MKRTITSILSITLALVMVLSLAACGGGGSSKEIEITTDNYSKYLNIKGYIACNESLDDAVYVGSLNGGMGIATPSGSTFYVYDSIYYYASVEGLSENFNYNDIKVTVKLTGSCKTFKTGSTSKSFNGSQSFEKDNIEIECDITGNGSFRETEKLSGGAYTHSEMVESNFEIVSISGTVTPA